MAYGSYPYGTSPYGGHTLGDSQDSSVNVPTLVITMTAPEPIVGIPYNFSTRKYNALERRSPCPN